MLLSGIDGRTIYMRVDPTKITIVSKLRKFRPWIPGYYYFDLYPIVLLYQMWLIAPNPFLRVHQHVDLIEV